jgi:hypothetical protein
VLLALAGAPEAAQWAAAHSQVPAAAAKQQQLQLETTCHFDTPLPIWCKKLPLAPCPSHEREMQVRVYSGAHWNSHGKFDFRLGKVQLACARHARWLAALAAIDAQPTAALVPLARRCFS